ncbi:MAG TPA: D-aminoacyl-tRNA deacylase [Paenalcaligenes sp.]|nr:D-aminoacyl-tRNA deacylase [Paenalcaligenes sp.]
MKCLLQRVKSAHVEVNGATVGSIEHGLLVFICAEPDDTDSTIQQAVDKILKLRIFSDDAGKMNLSLSQTQGGLLVVSQFTLAADTRKGNRPSFTQAAPPALGKTMYESFLHYAKTKHPIVASGEFGADMQIHLINDGPVTIPLEF